MRVRNCNSHSYSFSFISKISFVVFLFLNGLSSNIFANEEALHPFYDSPGHLGVDLYDYDGDNENKEQSKGSSSKNQSLPEPPIIDDEPSITIEV